MVDEVRAKVAMWRTKFYRKQFVSMQAPFFPSTVHKDLDGISNDLLWESQKRGGNFI